MKRSSLFLRHFEVQKNNIVSKIKLFLDNLKAQVGVETKAEKRWFWCAFTLLLIYLECVVFAQNTVLGTIPLYLSIVNAILVVPLCFAGVWFFSKIRLSDGSKIREERKSNRKKTWLFVAGVFFATFSILLLWQIAFWPGGFSPDSINQYGQIINGKYSDWHPVLHTWLFFWLPFQIFHKPAAIVTMQLLWFSLSVAYLLFVLYTNGCSKRFLILSWLYIILNPNTTQIMLYPWKDSAFSIFALVLFTQIIQIYATNGEWIRKWHNLLAFSVIVFLATAMRHNAILLTAPIIVVLFIDKNIVGERRNLAISTICVVVATVLLKGPIYSVAGVQKPDGRTVEKVGMPMTILSDVYVKDRSALSEEAREFMDSLGPQEMWKIYQMSNFNTIKWKNDKSPFQAIESAGASCILQYMLDASIKRPGIAWKAFATLTRTVWGFDGECRWGFAIGIWKNPHGISYHGNTTLKANFEAYDKNISTYATKYLFGFTGTIIIFLLFMAVSKLGRGNLSKVFMVLPLMAYNFGTMLLLSGPEDFRFFHLNFVVVVPLLYIILMKNGSDGNEKSSKTA